MKATAILLVALAVVFSLSSTVSAGVTTNVSTPISLTVPIPCANGGLGETVTLTGNLHILVTLTINANNVSGKLQGQPQGISGTGSVTGDKYQGTGVTDQSFKGSLQNGQFETTFINNFRIIGQGPGNNFTVHETLHITINANGTATATVVNTTTDCK